MHRSRAIHTLRSQNPEPRTRFTSQTKYPAAMSPPGDQQTGGRVAGSVFTISGEVLVVAVVFLFVVVAFVLFLYIYAKHYWGNHPALRRSRSRVHFVFADDPATFLRRGLDAAAVRALPVTVFRSVDFKEGLECSVCLSALSDGEEARLLPKCSHGFHVECIDMWFQAHSTCPLCRSPVGPDLSDAGAGSAEVSAQDPVSRDGYPPESLVLPTNVLFWGTPGRVNAAAAAAAAAAVGSREGPSSSTSTGSSSGKPEGMLVIDIPRRVMAEGFPSPISPLPSSWFPAEEMKTPTSARLRSLRRLLSGGKRTLGSSCSPRGGDIEQGLTEGGRAAGEGSALTPKPPTNS